MLGYQILPLELVEPLLKQKVLEKVYFYILVDIQYRIYVLHLFTDADNQPVDDLSKVAAINIESLLSKMSEISKGTVYNIHQSLLKEWGPESLVFYLKTQFSNF